MIPEVNVIQVSISVVIIEAITVVIKIVTVFIIVGRIKSFKVQKTAAKTIHLFLFASIPFCIIPLTIIHINSIAFVLPFFLIFSYFSYLPAILLNMKHKHHRHHHCRYKHVMKIVFHSTYKSLCIYK